MEEEDIETRDEVATELTKPCCTLIMRSQALLDYHLHILVK